jgi:hypothetical protein
MRILVIGGMHGNEPLGKDVVELFIRQPVEEIDTVLANERAIDRDCRFIENDLNRCFPGDPSSPDYEAQRASELLSLTKQYDIVLDFHNTYCPDNDCGFVGSTATQDLYDISAWLGLGRVIVADYECINKYAPNCLSVEVSLDSPAMNAQEWYRKVIQLSQMKTAPRSTNVEKYKFVYRMTLEDKVTYQLDTQQLAAFEPISPKLAQTLDVNYPAYPIFVADKYTPYNYGGLLNKIE